MRARHFLGVTVCLTAALTAQVASRVTNVELIRLTNAGLAEATIIKVIETSDCSFDTSVPALLAMKDAGVSEGVIRTMLEKQRGRPEQTNSAVLEIPEEPGVYVRFDRRGSSELAPLKTELITWLFGGVAKSMVLFTRGHINGIVRNPYSSRRVETPEEFLIRCAEGTNADEYQLLRFWRKGNRREFRIATGGVIHASGGADKNLVAFDSERLRPGVYRVRPREKLPQGEYGFLPPGAVLSASAASEGKIFTFGIE